MDDTQSLTENIRSLVQPWRAMVIAIDGRCGVGKSTLGRYLSWQLHIPLIETDLYLADEADSLVYRADDLKSVINSRLSKNRPVLVEGVVLRRTLRELGIEPAYVIYISAGESEVSPEWAEILEPYEKEFPPSTANCMISYEVHYRDRG